MIIKGMGAGRGKKQRLQARPSASVVFQDKVKKPLLKTMLGLSLAGVLISSGCGDKLTKTPTKNPGSSQAQSIPGDPAVAARARKQFVNIPDDQTSTIKSTGSAGSGGGPTDPQGLGEAPTKAGFIKQVDQMSARLEHRAYRITNRISVFESESQADSGQKNVLYRQLLGVFKKFSSQLQSLTPPTGDDAALVRYKQSWSELVSTISAYMQAGSSDDTLLVPKLQQRIYRYNARIKAAASEYGFRSGEVNASIMAFMDYYGESGTLGQN